MFHSEIVRKLETLYEIVFKAKEADGHRDEQLRSLGESVRLLTIQVGTLADENTALKNDVETANRALHSQRRMIAALEGRALPVLRSTLREIEDVELTPEPA